VSYNDSVEPEVYRSVLSKRCSTRVVFSRWLRPASQSVQRQAGASHIDDVQQQRHVPVFPWSLVPSWCLRLELNVSSWRSLDPAARRRLQTLVSYSLVKHSDVKSLRTSWPRGRNFVFGLEVLSSASASTICSRHVLKLFILASWKWVMMELVVTVSLQWLSAKVIYLLTSCYWYKLIQVHVHGSI